MSEIPAAKVPAAWSIEVIERGDCARASASRLMTKCHEIRRVVFVDEQAVPAELEWDGLDAEAEHFVLFESQAQRSAAEPLALATARLRLFPSYAKVERVAVLAEARGRGVGRTLMEAVHARAMSLGHTQVRLSAQVSALAFYQGLGYVAHGEPFVEAGIDHRKMSKSLEGEAPRTP